MLMISTDQNNDIYIASDGNLATSTGLQACAAACEHAVKAQLGEMLLAINQGVPNYETVWSDAANVVQFEFFVRRAITGVEGVIEVSSFSVTVEDNAVKYEAEIVTIYGSGVING